MYKDANCANTWRTKNTIHPHKSCFARSKKSEDCVTARSTAAGEIQLLSVMVHAISWNTEMKILKQCELICL